MKEKSLRHDIFHAFGNLPHNEKQLLNLFIIRTCLFHEKSKGKKQLKSPLIGFLLKKADAFLDHLNDYRSILKQSSWIIFEQVLEDSQQVADVLSVNWLRVKIGLLKYSLASFYVDAQQRLIKLHEILSKGGYYSDPASHQIMNLDVKDFIVYFKFLYPKKLFKDSL